MSNTRYHSIGLTVKEKQESNPGRQSDDRMGENSRGKANLKRWVLSFERNVETDNELRVSGGREFQSLGATTEKAFLGGVHILYNADGVGGGLRFCYTLLYMVGGGG